MRRTSAIPDRILTMVVEAPRGLNVKEVAKAAPCSTAYAAETLRWLFKMGAPIRKTHYSGTLVRWVEKSRVQAVKAEIDAAVKARKQATAAKCKRVTRAANKGDMSQNVVSAAKALKPESLGARSVFEWR